MAAKNLRPSRDAIARVMQDLEKLWKPPPGNENARRQPGADTSNTYSAKDRSISELWQFMRGRRGLCRAICPDKFFNYDASLEIDRLTIENEILRAEVKK